MIKFETINELTLKVTTTGNDVIFTKTGVFYRRRLQRQH